MSSRNAYTRERLPRCERIALFDYASQSMEDVPTCPVCGTTNPRTRQVDRYGYTVGWSVCPCGLEYLNPRMTAEAYRAFYQGSYRRLFTAWHRQPYDFAIMEKTQMIWGAGLGQRLKRWGVTGGTLLDVGGSTGAVAAGLRRAIRFERVTVLDPSGPELERAKDRGFATIQADAEDGPDVGRFDTMVCTQTIDHLREPMRALAWMRRSGDKLWIDAACSVIKIDHPCRWNPSSLRLALEQSGWTLQKYGQEKASKHWGVWCG